MSKIFLIRYDGSYLGGRAIVQAVNESHAWHFLKQVYPDLKPQKECSFKEIKNTNGVLYNWDGNY